MVRKIETDDAPVLCTDTRAQICVQASQSGPVGTHCRRRPPSCAIVTAMIVTVSPQCHTGVGELNVHNASFRKRWIVEYALRIHIHKVCISEYAHSAHQQGVLFLEGALDSYIMRDGSCVTFGLHESFCKRTEYQYITNSLPKIYHDNKISHSQHDHD